MQSRAANRVCSRPLPAACAALQPPTQAPCRLLAPLPELAPRPAQERVGGAVTQRRHARLLAPPPRVTNTTDEIYKAVGKAPPNPEEEDIEVSQLQVHYPELGILENRVGKMYLEELFNDSGVDIEESGYWFHTPPGGWATEPVKMQPAEEAPVTLPQPMHEDASGRSVFEDLEEGAVVTGFVSDCWLYHGIQVDFGAACDGLVPIPQDIWMEPGVRETLLPGVRVTARVHKVRMPGLYRWPVQMQLIDPPQIAALLPPPEQYHAPIDHNWCSDRGYDIDDICAITGRRFAPALYALPTDHAIDMEGVEMAYGYDDDASNFYMEDPMAPYIIGVTGQTLITESIDSMYSAQ